MPFSNLNLPFKIQGVTLCLVTQYFFLSQYFECKQADIEWILNKVSNNHRLQIPRPGRGGREGFHIRFSCERSKRYVEFDLAPDEGVGRVFILDFHVNVASDMWNLGFKGLLHILMNPIFFFIIIFVSHSIFL